MTQARETLTGKWGTVAIATLVYFLASVVANIIAQFIPILGCIVVLVVTGPLIFGYSAYMLSFSRGGTPDIPVLFTGFNCFVKTLFLYILVAVITLVGFILLVIPGIMAALALSMVWFIMLDNPQMGVIDVATASYNMTNGSKWKLFCLACRFIGWAILCIFTLGIGFLFLFPYMQVSLVKFYDEIKSGEATAPSHVS